MAPGFYLHYSSYQNAPLVNFADNKLASTLKTLTKNSSSQVFISQSLFYNSILGPTPIFALSPALAIARYIDKNL